MNISIRYVDIWSCLVQISMAEGGVTELVSYYSDMGHFSNPSDVLQHLHRAAVCIDIHVFGICLSGVASWAVFAVRRIRVPDVLLTRGGRVGVVCKNNQDHKLASGDLTIAVIIIQMIFEKWIGHPNTLGPFLARID
jgi:hypothetical protein